MTVTGYLGKTVTINCSYPAEFETNHKYFYRLDGQYFFILINTNSTKKGRFSISDDRRSKVVSVRISDVRGDDGGVYFCAVGIREKSVGFYTLFTRMQLIPAPGSSVIINIIIIIAVSVCAVLLLIGGLTLIFYKRRCTKTQDCSITSRGSGKNDTNEHEYENDLPGNQNIIRMGQIYHNLKSDTNQSDSVYQSLDLRSKEPDSVYHSLKPNTNPIMSGRP
ncbi:uncharacterized protein [Salminus brasiliensis]|uniref:uncharacterized protein n=1 Tax=Salminus brasiliensis TaxID=930266 RepID=UPI003B839612